MHTAICDKLNIEFPIFRHCGMLQGQAMRLHTRHDSHGHHRRGVGAGVQVPSRRVAKKVALILVLTIRLLTIHHQRRHRRHHHLHRRQNLLRTNRFAEIRKRLEDRKGP
jgi:hypothetical protein